MRDERELRRMTAWARMRRKSGVRKGALSRRGQFVTMCGCPPSMCEQPGQASSASATVGSRADTTSRQDAVMSKWLGVNVQGPNGCGNRCTFGRAVCAQAQCDGEIGRRIALPAQTSQPNAGGIATVRPRLMDMHLP